MLQSDSRFTELQQTVLGWAIVGIIIICLSGLLAALLFVIMLGIEEVRRELMTQHFVAVVGIPAAAVSGVVILVIFRQTEGPIEIEIEILTLKARGPQAQR